MSAMKSIPINVLYAISNLETLGLYSGKRIARNAHAMNAISTNSLKPKFLPVINGKKSPELPKSVLNSKNLPSATCHAKNGIIDKQMSTIVLRYFCIQFYLIRIR
jgi:hypothetical protein